VQSVSVRRHADRSSPPGLRWMVSVEGGYGDSTICDEPVHSDPELSTIATFYQIQMLLLWSR
jgi:hypothetical protein